jgi:hypothetical protein
MFFGTDFLCKCNPQPILKKIISSSNGKIEYTSVVQNRMGSARSDSEILIESFSDEEENGNSTKKDQCDVEAKDASETSDVTSNGGESPGANAVKVESPDGQNDAAEIRRLLRRKDELERKQKMQERYDERLQVSAIDIKFYFTISIRAVVDTFLQNMKAGYHNIISILF